jgi:hypothetical protein
MQRKVINQKRVLGVLLQNTTNCEARAGLTSDPDALAAIFEGIEQSVEDDYLHGEPVRPGMAKPFIRSVKIRKAGTIENKPRRSGVCAILKRKQLSTSGD